MFYAVIALILAVLAMPAGSSLAADEAAPSCLRQVQMPQPFGAQPGPQLPDRQQCTPERRKNLEAQVEAYEKLQSLSRNEGEQFCTLLENAEDLGKLGDGKMIEQILPPDVRELLKALGIDFEKTDMRAVLRMLGVDLDKLDFRKIKAHCRLTQGEADRLFTTEIGRLKRELLACEDTI